MTTREASIRLTLKPGTFQAGLRRMTSMVRSAGTTMGNALREPMKKGLEGVGKEMSSMFDEMKTGFKAAATLGGALSLGGAIKGAVDAEAAYAQLSTSMSILSKQTVTVAEVQGAVERAAEDSAESLGNLQLMANQLAAVGDVGIMEESLAKAAKQAKRLGVEGELVARTYSRLIAKGIAQSAEEAEVLTEQINTFGRVVLGIDPDEAIDPNDVAEYAAFVNTMNSSLKQTNALMGMTGGKAKDLGGAIEILEELGLVLNTRKGLKELRKGTKLTTDDINMSRGAIENMMTVLEERGPKGFKILQDALATDRAKAAIREIIGEEIVIQAETGKITKEEWNLRIAGLRSQLAEAEKATVDMGALAEKDAAIRKTTSANFQDAMNEVSKAFADEEMIKAIREIATHLPELAKKLAGFLAWVTENPRTAAAGLVLGRVGIAFAGPAIQAAGTAGFKKLWGVMAARAAGVSIGGMAGKAAGATIPVGGAAVGLGGVAGLATAAAGVIGAGAAGYAVGDIAYEAGVKPALEGSFDTLRSMQNTLADVSSALRAGGPEQKRAALENVKAQLKEAREGPGTVAAATGAIVNFFTGGEVKSATEAYREKEAQLLRAQSALERSMTGTARPFDELKTAAAGAAEVLKTVAGADARGGVRGPKSGLSTEPGSAGKRG